MPEYQTIHVSQADIDAGLPKRSYKCALALAFQRQVQVVETASAGYGCIRAVMCDGSVVHYDPHVDDVDKVVTFVSRFDKGRMVKPMSVRYAPRYPLDQVFHLLNRVARKAMEVNDGQGPP